MRASWDIFKMGCRAALWKATSSPPPAGLRSVVFWAVLVIAVTILDHYVEAAAPARFDIYGLTSVTACLALTLVVIALFFPPEGRATAICAALVLSMLSSLATTAVALVPIGNGVWESWRPGVWTETDTQWLLFFLQTTWWVGGMFAILRSLQPNGGGRRLGRIAALTVLLLAVSAAFPHLPAFEGRNFDRRTANYWEYFAAVMDGSFDQSEPRRSRVPPSIVELRQAALLDEAASKLRPQRRGVTDIYSIGIAGWADQDIFDKELDGGLRALSRVLPIEGREMRLINHPDTTARSPIATRQNFAAAVRAVARRMDRKEDVLLLFFTSHGSRQGLALSFWRLANASLSPEDVVAVLDEEGVKNRVLIVSACYSGVFVAPLRDENTIVMTAADERSPSFGCSDQREWTYFGEAFFERALAPGRDLEHAFKMAAATIAEWEARDKLPASNPQGHFGRALVQRLAPVYLPVAHTESRRAGN
jgi:hypothetical protein